MVSTDAPCQEHSGFVSLMPLKAGFEFLKLEENGKAFRKSITSSGSVTHTNEAVSYTHLENEKLLHYNVGCHAADAGIDAVFLVGELSKETARGVEAKNPSITCRHFDTKEELIRALPDVYKRQLSPPMEIPPIRAFLSLRGSLFSSARSF